MMHPTLGPILVSSLNCGNCVDVFSYEEAGFCLVIIFSNIISGVIDLKRLSFHVSSFIRKLLVTTEPSHCINHCLAAYNVTLKVLSS